MTTVYTLAVWGAANSDASWIDWFRFMEQTAKNLGAPLTHFGIKGKGLRKKDIRLVDTFREIESRIESSQVEWLSGYSLPDDFQTAAFDYSIHMTRCSSYVAISAKEDFASGLIDDSNGWKEKATQFCSFEKGVLFQMNDAESPLLFVSGSSSHENFDSLVILKNLN